MKVIKNIFLIEQKVKSIKFFEIKERLSRALQRGNFFLFRNLNYQIYNLIMH